MSHTPGPWYEHSHRQIGPDEGIVCEVWSAIGWGDEAIKAADANVRLIAAAPDLLDALQLARGCIVLDRDSLIECETHPATGEVEPAAEDAIKDYDATIAVIDAAIAKATGEQS